MLCFGMFFNSFVVLTKNQMKKTTKLLLPIVALFVFVSCKDEVGNSPESIGFTQVSNSGEMRIPNDFTFSTSRVVAYDFDLTNAPSDKKYRLDFFTFLPEAGGELMLSEFVDGQSVASGNVLVPAYTQTIYLRLNAPDGSSALYLVNAESTSTSANLFSGKKSTKTSAPVSPDCTTGCEQSYNNQSGDVAVNSNDPAGVYCFSGNHTGNISINRSGVTVRICGNADIDKVAINQGSSLEIASGGSLRVMELGVNSATGIITVYTNARLETVNGFSTAAQTVNYGDVIVGSNYQINSNGSMVNNGYLEVGVDLNQNSSFTNNNHTYVKDDFNLNSNSNTINNCKLEVGDDIHTNSIFTNTSYAAVGDEWRVNSGSTTTLENGAYIQANRVTLNTVISGTGNTSLVKLVSNPSIGNNLITDIRSSSGIIGNIEYCDPNGIEINNGSISNGAVENCNLYVPTSTCNPAGNGTPTIVDSDNDQVADGMDEYPNDPDRASNDFLPSENSFGTLAYEDLWPALGDYDFNDLVVDYNFTMVKNANSEVVDIKAKYVVRAIGGSFTNGFGIQLNTAPSNVASVTGQVLTENFITNSANGTEAGQTNATIIVFDNASSVLPNPGTVFTNTTPGQGYSTPDTTEIVINFSTPQAMASLGTAPFNPFLIVDKDRGVEVHLAGEAPTDLADQQLFGTGDDDSNGSSKLYQSPSNLVWALNISTGFDYPNEKADIVTVYSNFASWAQSGGTQNLNWYIDLPGNIVNSNVYQAP
jgi:LruC domain-containing protein